MFTQIIAVIIGSAIMILMTAAVIGLMFMAMDKPKKNKKHTKNINKNKERDDHIRISIERE